MGLPKLSPRKTALVAKLAAIAKLVRAGNWIRSHYTVQKGGKAQYCLVGHVNRATNEYCLSASSGAIYHAGFVPKTQREKLLVAIWKAIQVVTPYTTCQSIEAWNDRRTTTPEQVLEVLAIAQEKVAE